MYRKVAAIPLLLFVGYAVFQLFYTLALLGDYLFLQVITWGRLPLAPPYRGAAVLSAVLALCWAAAFHPGRQYSVWKRVIKYCAMAGGIGLALAVPLLLGGLTGMQAMVLLAQTHASPAQSLLASMALGALPEALALSLFLAAPFYWLIRGIQVRSLQRATFEAWVEAKRLIIPGVVLLVAGALLNAWAGPALTTWILR